MLNLSENKVMQIASVISHFVYQTGTDLKRITVLLLVRVSGPVGLSTAIQECRLTKGMNT